MYPRLYTSIEQIPDEAPSIEVEELDFEEIEYPAYDDLDFTSYDRRFETLSSEAKSVIHNLYHDDVDLAAYAANMHINSCRRPAPWVMELVNKQRAGWKE